jgi:thioredoxin reductase (NADPH)
MPASITRHFLSVLVLESNAPGGQAGSSSRIENYLGFPMGISGQELADRAFVQAEKFGAQISIARTASGLKCVKPPYTVELDDGGFVQGRTIIIAAGSRYRKLSIPNIDQFYMAANAGLSQASLSSLGTVRPSRDV